MDHGLEPSTPPAPPPPTLSCARERHRGELRTKRKLMGELLERALSMAGAGDFGRALRYSGGMARIEHEPFTIFAPSDAAIAELPPPLLDDRDRLTRILGFHVIEGAALRSHELTHHVESSIGQRLRTIRRDGAVQVDEARVLWADLRAGAGIIHVIDRVLMPAELDSLELLHISDNFHRLVTACELTELESLLRGKLPHTLLAPRGLTLLPTWAWHELLAPRRRRRLRALLERHLVPGRHYLESAAQLRTLDGEQLTVTRTRGDFEVEGRRVLLPDLDTRTGLIHVIEEFLP